VEKKNEGVAITGPRRMLSSTCADTSIRLDYILRVEWWYIVSTVFASNKFVSAASGVREIALPFIIFSFFFPTIFGVAIGGCIVAASHNAVLRDFDDVKVAISLGQAAFGIYIGQFLYSLFETTPESGAATK
jgi:hypothetical protein